MRLHLVALLVLAGIPASSFAQKREVQELQRDVANLQDQVRTLQRTLDEKMSALTVLVQQTLERSNESNKSVAVLDSRLKEQTEEQVRKVSEPVAGLGMKVDQMSIDFQTVRESMRDLTSRMGKIEQKLTDLSTEVRSINAPAPPPPGSDLSPSSSSSPSSAAMSTGAPAISADVMYDNAYRDYIGGKYELALQQFADYLQYYATSERAPNAQFWIGQIYYDKGDYEAAIKNFDLVAENFGDSNKSGDARFMKGQALLKNGSKSNAAAEFRKVVTDYPGTDVSKKACSTLRGLGYNCPAPTTTRRSSR